MVSLILTLYYMGGRGTLCMDTYRITSSFSANAPYELRFHDFVSSNILKVVLRPFFNKTEKPFSLQDDEKEGTIMTELVKFLSPNKQKPKQQLKELPKQ